MTEAAKENVVEIKKSTKKYPRPRIELVQPTHIVDVWRLVEASIRDGNQVYPDASEDSPEVIRQYLFWYLSQPGFIGLIAKIGRRPVGILLTNVSERPYGRPKRFMTVYCAWVDPKFRQQGVAKVVWANYVAHVKKQNVFHLESRMNEQCAQMIEKCGIKLDRVGVILAGRL